MRAALLLILVAATPASPVMLPQGSRLALPDGVAAEWMIPPAAAKNSGAEVSLSVDSAGEPWLVVGHRAIFVPGQNALMRADRPFQQLLWLDERQQVVRSYSALGRFVPGAADAGMPELQFVPVAMIPLSHWRLAGASEGAVFVSGYNPRKKLWQLAKLTGRSLVILVQTKAPITASAVPDHGLPVVATGRSVWVVGNGTPQLLFVHPRETVRRLVYADDSLFYATDEGVGVVKGGKAADFLRADGCQISSAGRDFYVLLGSLSRGLLRIREAGRLASR